MTRHPSSGRKRLGGERRTGESTGPQIRPLSEGRGKRRQKSVLRVTKGKKEDKRKEKKEYGWYTRFRSTSETQETFNRTGKETLIKH